MLNTDRLCLGCMTDNGGEKVCPICGYDSASKNPEGCLPPKTMLKDRYLVGKFLKDNGEGITYIGWDNVNDTVVNIKEYFPQGFAHRNPDMTVSMKSGGEYTFNEGLLEFKEIKCNIMRSDFPSLVPVIDVFEDNGTVYAVESSISGITLNEFLIKNGGALKWEQVRALFLPLIDTLKGMNDIGLIHGGISADTVLVGRDGKLRISDYSIRKLRLKNSEINSSVYAGYAAIEQYGLENTAVGTYTDVYGLCATLFRVLIGSLPPEACDRLKNDSMSIPSKFAEELPRHVLVALANGLQILPRDRTRDIETLKNQLVYGEIPNSEPQKHRNAEDNKDISSSKAPKKKRGGSFKYVLMSSGITTVVFLIIAAVLVFGVFKEDIFPDSSSKIPSSSSESSAPVVDQIGDIDSGAEVTAKLYPVPDFRGKYYSKLIEEEDYEIFNFVIADKKFSDKYPKGTVVSQSVKAGEKDVPKDTEIKLTLSLGPKEIKVASVINKTKDEAIIELLKQGFIFENITVTEKYDPDSMPGVIVEQVPAANEKVNTDINVEIFVNIYEPEENNDDPTTDSSSQSTDSLTE